jgi:hypothetical protein
MFPFEKGLPGPHTKFQDRNGENLKTRANLQSNLCDGGLFKIHDFGSGKV